MCLTEDEPADTRHINTTRIVQSLLFFALHQRSQRFLAVRQGPIMILLLFSPEAYDILITYTSIAPLSSWLDGMSLQDTRSR